MTNTPTSNFGYNKPSLGSRGWGVPTLNDNLDAIDADFAAEHRSDVGNHGKHGPKVTIVQSGNDNALVVTKSDTGSIDVITIANSGSGWDIKGTTGVWGATKDGIIACMGITGPNLIGATGAQGQTGLAGTNGSAGTQGNTGIQGQTGLAGANGSAGVQGTTGIQGQTGIQGATGPGSLQAAYVGGQTISGTTGISITLTATTGAVVPLTLSQSSTSSAAPFIALGTAPASRRAGDINFSATNRSADPTNPTIGDVWYLANTTAGQINPFRYMDSASVVRSFVATQADGNISVSQTNAGASTTTITVNQSSTTGAPFIALGTAPATRIRGDINFSTTNRSSDPSAAGLSQGDFWYYDNTVVGQICPFRYKDGYSIVRSIVATQATGDVAIEQSSTSSTAPALALTSSSSATQFLTFGTAKASRVKGDINFSTANRGVDPSGPVEGDLWYNTSDNAFKYRDHTDVRTIATGSITLQAAYDGGKTITESGTNIRIINSGTNEALVITQNGAGFGIRINEVGESQGLRIEKSATGTQNALHVLNSGTGVGVFIGQRGTGYGIGLQVTGSSVSTAPSIEVDNNGTGAGILVNQSGNAIALDINQTTTANTANVIDIINSGSGFGLNIIQSGNGKACRITKDGTDNIDVVVFENTTGAGDTLELWQYGTGVCLNVKKTSTGAGDAVLIENAGDGYALHINQTKSTNPVIYIDNGSTADSILDDSGAKLTAAGSWTNASTRVNKTNLEEIQTIVFKNVQDEIIDIGTKIDQVQIYRFEHKKVLGVKQIGMMAEDFYEAFGLGADNKTISPSDMAAILWYEVQRLRARVKALEEK